MARKKTTTKTEKADPMVNTVVESVGAKQTPLAAPSEPEAPPAPEPEAQPTKAAQDAAAAPQREVRGNLIPLTVFCRLKGKRDQVFAFKRFGESQRWGRRTIEAWNKTWDDFQKREIK